MKWKPGLEEEVELLIAEVLKHAPAAHTKSLRVGWNSRWKTTKLNFHIILNKI
ncbi:hypothetical protein AALO_G00146720 [Alosa alosa]|uniref:Uncharacterized protein n=1 Tax=Alosa alosa TaxID=278164 RepID=A0AAV6GER8_9TELE|nr:hypothetical protein AALO_G00146720 [Alosa alosa]